MMGEVRWVGDSDEDFTWFEISIAGGGGEMVRGLSLGRFLSFFSFSFCNHAFIVFRYKKPHAALAMERTKPINQNK